MTGAGNGISFASFLRFWAVAARRNSSRAPPGTKMAAQAPARAAPWASVKPGLAGCHLAQCSCAALGLLGGQAKPGRQLTIAELFRVRRRVNALDVHCEERVTAIALSPAVRTRLSAAQALRPMEDTMPKTRKRAASGPVAKTGKIGQITLLLSRPQGARLDEMVTATGWQAHSVRGALSGAIKKQLKLNLQSEKTEGGRIYRIAEEPNT